MRERKWKKVSRPARFPVVPAGNRSCMIFVTVCTRDRQPILANDKAHQILLEAWAAADIWLVGRYCIMPDHLHLFCAPASPEPCSIQQWSRYWKSCASRAWPNPQHKPLWQPNLWDRQMRRHENYSAKWCYVRNNPVRHELVPSPEQWPYQGEMNVLTWHDA